MNSNDLLTLAQRMREYNHNPHHINPVSESFHTLVKDSADALSAVAEELTALKAQQVGQEPVLGCERYRVEPRNKGFWPYCVKAGNGERELYFGHKKECDLVAAELACAFEDGKFCSTPQPSAVQGVNAQLLESATESLDEIQAVMQEAYNSAMPVCCGRAQNECCGSPDPEWNEHDPRTMDRFAPIERALRAAIAAARKGEGK